MAVEDIKQVQDVIARESKLLVYTHFNMVVGVPAAVSYTHLDVYKRQASDQISKHLFRVLFRQDFLSGATPL